MFDRRTLLVAGGALLLPPIPARAAAPAAVAVEPQPFFAMLQRVIAAFAGLGEPLAPVLTAQLATLAAKGDAAAVADAQALLAPLVLLDLPLGREGYATPVAGPIAPALVEQGWRSFLVRVVNPHSVRAALLISLDQPVLGDIERRSRSNIAHQRQSLPTPSRAIDEVARARLAVELFDRPPLDRLLTGLAVEYRIVSLTAFGAGRFETGVTAAALDTPQFVWAPSARARLAFVAEPSRDTAFAIRDADGRPTVAGLTVRDGQGRLYPSRAGRIEPDMFFQDQVYRADGETLRLPAGKYSAVATRGPEYLVTSQDFRVPGPPPTLQLERWVDPAANGWYSGDVHVHGAGCSHYTDPTVGVGPSTMARHANGEGLWIAEVLSWGPGWEVQSQNFTGHAVQPSPALDQPALQAAHRTTLKASAVPADGLIRYDVEVSGFPSSFTGHLVLLRLTDQHYPGTRDPRDWPSWSLPILQWAKAQGAVTGFAHSGLGLSDLDGPVPSLSIPSFDMIGANEYLVDVAHDAIDFLAGGDTIAKAELTLWYHALNCGFRTVMAGETDWPCLSDKAVGAGRSYVRLAAPPRGDAGYQAWVEGLKAGRVYMGDGRAHIFDFAVEDAEIGDMLGFRAPRTVRVGGTLRVRLDATPPADLADIGQRPDYLDPMWHLERARVPGTRTVRAEMIVNGRVVAVQDIIADGRPQRFVRRLTLEHSSWVALRIMPGLHTNPVFVEIAGQPIRGPRSSADWCLASLAKIQSMQLPQIRSEEREAARAAYEAARARFTAIRAECPA